MNCKETWEKIIQDARVHRKQGTFHNINNSSNTVRLRYKNYHNCNEYLIDIYETEALDLFKYLNSIDRYSGNLKSFMEPEKFYTFNVDTVRLGEGQSPSPKTPLS